MENMNNREIRKVNWFFPILIIGYIFLSVLAAVALNHAGNAVPGWIKFILSEAIILVIALAFLIVNKINPFKTFGYKKIGFLDILFSILIGYCIVPVSLLLSSISQLFTKNYVNDSVNDLLKYPFFVQVILMSIIPALVEEFVFRGLFFSTYKKKYFFKSIALTGLMFGCFHMNINQFIYATFMGMLFAYLVGITGSIWSSVLAHAAFNTYSISMIALLNMILKALGKGDYMEYAASVSENEAANNVVAKIIGIVFLASLAAGFLVLVYLMLKNMAKRHNQLDKISFKGIRANCSGERVANNQPVHRQGILDIPLLCGLFMCISYMVIMEILIKLV